MNKIWLNLTDLSVSPINLVIRAIIVYLAVLLLLRFSGKRQMGQMSPTEFVALLLISNAVQNAMNAGDNSLLGGLILAAGLIALSWCITKATFHTRWARTLFEGTPTLIIHHGAIIEKNRIKENLTLNEIHRLLRKQGIHHLKEIDSAILESDGTLSIVQKV